MKTNWKTRDQAVLHPLHHPSAHQDPVIVDSGEGIYVHAVDGRTYIDGLSGLWNVLIGHGNRELGEVAQEQMGCLAFFSGYAGASNLPAIELAEKLAGFAYPDLQTTFFASGGAEANESAFKTARYYWKQRGKPDKVKIIARQDAYHGVTLAAMSATGITPYWPMFEPRVPGFLHIPAPYPYRFEGEVRPNETIGQAAARALEEAILREGADTVAAFIAEPVVGSSAGCLVADQAYWSRVRDVCSEHGVLLIVDEVMTGFGRTGRRMGVENLGIRPDIVVGGKGLAGGYAPIGGVFASEEVVAPIAAAGDSFMFFTYGAQDASCAVADAVLRTIDDEDLVTRAGSQGAALRARLEARLGDHPHVGEIRGLGLMLGITLVADRDGPQLFPLEAEVYRRVVAEGLRRDVWIYPASSGPAAPDAVMFGPAFTVTDAELDTMVDVLAESIDAAVARRASSA